jgi:hypothetical protein
MEAVTNHGNLICAFEEVAQNRGAPGPDGRSIDEVRTHLAELLPLIRRALLDRTYRPAMIRRLWIPKAGGGERGLGIPDVVDRWVQQAVYRVLSPHWESTSHHRAMASDRDAAVTRPSPRRRRIWRTGTSGSSISTWRNSSTASTINA